MESHQIVLLDRVYCAAKALVHVKDKKSSNSVMAELRAAVQALENYRGDDSFDMDAYLKDLT